MKLILATLAALSFAATAAAQSGPGKHEVGIEDVIVNGSGCPIGSVEAMLTNSTPGGPYDYFQVVFDDFIVEKPGKARKFCNVLLNIKYPEGWSYSVNDVQTDGYANLADGVRGTIKISYRYRNTNRGRDKTRKQDGPYEDDYEFYDRFAHPVYSECGKVYPINLKTEIKLTGKGHEPSMMTVDRQSGVLTQFYKIRWKRC